MTDSTINECDDVQRKTVLHTAQKERKKISVTNSRDHKVSLLL